jgi:hypothetical protein
VWIIHAVYILRLAACNEPENRMTMMKTKAAPNGNYCIEIRATD